MMKKLFLTTTILASFVLFTACGDDSSSGPEGESSSSVELEDESSSSEEAVESSSSQKVAEGKSSESKDDESSSSEKENSSSSVKSDDDDSSSSGAVSSSSVSANPFAGRVAAPYCNVSLSGDTVTMEYGFDEFNQRATFAWNAKKASVIGNGSDCDNIKLLREMLVYDDECDLKTMNECSVSNLELDVELSITEEGIFGETSIEGVKSILEGAFCPYMQSRVMPTEHLNPKVKYGNFIDPRDYRVYKTVEIGNQTWMAQNMDYREVNSGETLCYGNDEEYCAKYGALYDWIAVQEACPEGWHLPTLNEFELLINHADPTYSVEHTDELRSEIAGEYLKSVSGWKNEYNGNDDFGFSALPAGGFFRGDVNNFTNEGFYTYFWSSTEYGAYDGVYRLNLYKEVAVLDWEYKTSNLSVRCVKDSD